MEAQTLLDSGVALKDAGAFFDTPSGLSAFEEHAWVLNLEAGSVYWIPYGWFVIPVAFAAEGKQKQDVDEECDEETEQSKKPEFGFALVWTPLLPTRAARVPSPTWKAIASWNNEHISKSTELGMWKDRQGWLKDFYSKVEKVADSS